MASTTRRPALVENDVAQGIECEHGQYYPYPSSCTLFQVCVNGKLVQQECGPGLHWNNVKNMCDWAHKGVCGRKKEAKKPQGSKGEQSVPLEVLIYAFFEFPLVASDAVGLQDS